MHAGGIINNELMSSSPAAQDLEEDDEDDEGAEPYDDDEGGAALLEAALDDLETVKQLLVRADSKVRRVNADACLLAFASNAGLTLTLNVAILDWDQVYECNAGHQAQVLSFTRRYIKTFMAALSSSMINSPKPRLSASYFFLFQFLSISGTHIMCAAAAPRH